MTRFIPKITIIVLLLVWVTACGSSNTSQQTSSQAESTSSSATDDYKPEISNIILASGPIGGGWYNTAAGLAEILMSEIPGLNITVIEGGGVPNIQDLANGEVHLGYAFASDFYAALNGTHAFEGNPVTNVKGLMTLYTSYTQAVVLADSGINSYADLKDKRLLPGQRNWATASHLPVILNAYGIDYEQMEKDGKVSYTGYSEMPILLQDGNADFMWGMSAAPSSFIMEINALRDIKFLAMEPEIQALLSETFPGVVPLELPANTYEGQTEPVPTVGTHSLILIREDVPEELAYRIVKATMNQINAFKAVDPVLENFNEDTMVENISEENLHPGVIRYLNEINK